MSESLTASPRNPGSEFALKLSDIVPGLAYVTYIPLEGRAIQHGVFRGEPVYGEDESGWTAEADVETPDRTTVRTFVNLHQAGIVPDYDGQGWSRIVTIAETE